MFPKHLYAHRKDFHYTACDELLDNVCAGQAAFEKEESSVVQINFGVAFDRLNKSDLVFRLPCYWCCN